MDRMTGTRPTLTLDNEHLLRFVHEMERFELWASNLGVLHSGHSSLDYRFRDSPPLFEYAFTLLTDLQNELSAFTRQVTTPILADEDMLDAPDSLPLSDDESEEDLSSYRDQSLTAEYLTNISITVDRLYALSFRVRNPKMRTGLSKALSYTEVDSETGLDLIEAYRERDIRHLVELFRSWRGQDLEGHFLVQRLARANVHRRQQFKYWEKRKAKYDYFYHAATAHHKEGQATTTHVSTRHSEPSAATNLDLGAMLENESAPSLDSFQATANDTDDLLKAPPPPKLEGDSEEFECHYCYTIRHIMRDLRPYVCTFQECKDADQQYDTFTEWVTHESSSHGVQFKDLRTCPICAQPNRTTHHVASHLRRIASFAFPRWADTNKGSNDPLGQTDSADSKLIPSNTPSAGSASDDEWTVNTKTVYLQLVNFGVTNVQLHVHDGVEKICASHLRMVYKFAQSTTFRFADPNGNTIPLEYDSLYDNMVIHVDFYDSVYVESYPPQGHHGRTNTVLPEPAVFSILWHENDNSRSAYGTLVSRGPQYRGRFGELVYSTIRRLVVFKDSDQLSLCFAISTYGGQGVAKRGVDPSRHAIIYMRDTRPAMSSQEPRMEKDPLEVVPEDPEQQLDLMSRLNFGRIYTVEHNVPMLPMGRIANGSMAKFFQYARDELEI
ncbi:hypothetical protein BDV06DRAFT_231901 [Aspergillus oleicola]